MRPQTGPELLELCRALSVPLAEVDREGVIRDCSEALAELLQCAPGELKGRALIEFSPAPEELIAVHEETLRAGAARDQLLSLRGPKGDEVAVGVSTLAQRDAAGAVTGYLLAVRDSPARKRAEEDFRRDERRLESLLRIAQYQADDVDDLLRIALEEAIVLTDSRVGYIFHYNEEKREFRLSNRSRDVMAECSVEGPQAVYQLDSTGLWGEVVRQRRAIMVNDFAAPHPLKRGYPEGHAPLHRFLSIPVFRRNRIVMVVGVANKESVYDASDTRQLTLLMDSVLKSLEHIRDEAELRKLSRAVEHSPTTIVITGLV